MAPSPLKGEAIMEKGPIIIRLLISLTAAIAATVLAAIDMNTPPQPPASELELMSSLVQVVLFLAFVTGIHYLALHLAPWSTAIGYLVVLGLVILALNGNLENPVGFIALALVFAPVIVPLAIGAVMMAGAVLYLGFSGPGEKMREPDPRSRRPPMPW